MKIAGAILALIAGLFGFVFAVIILLIGGLGEYLGTVNAIVAVAMGWIILFFSFAVLTFAALSFGKNNFGMYLIFISLCGIALGETLFAWFLVLSFIGGILMLFDNKEN